MAKPCAMDAPPEKALFYKSKPPAGSFLYFFTQVFYTQVLWDDLNQNSFSFGLIFFFFFLSKGMEKLKTRPGILIMGTTLESGTSRTGRSHNFSSTHISNFWSCSCPALIYSMLVFGFFLTTFTTTTTFFTTFFKVGIEVFEMIFRI